jgi:hypothetical protein
LAFMRRHEEWGVELGRCFAAAWHDGEGKREGPDWRGGSGSRGVQYREKALLVGWFGGGY